MMPQISHRTKQITTMQAETASRAYTGMQDTEAHNNTMLFKGSSCKTHSFRQSFKGAFTRSQRNGKTAILGTVTTSSNIVNASATITSVAIGSDSIQNRKDLLKLEAKNTNSDNSNVSPVIVNEPAVSCRKHRFRTKVYNLFHCRKAKPATTGTPPITLENAINDYNSRSTPRKSNANSNTNNNSNGNADSPSMPYETQLTSGSSSQISAFSNEKDDGSIQTPQTSPIDNFSSVLASDNQKTNSFRRPTIGTDEDKYNLKNFDVVNRSFGKKTGTSRKSKKAAGSLKKSVDVEEVSANSENHPLFLFLPRLTENAKQEKTPFVIDFDIDVSFVDHDNNKKPTKFKLFSPENNSSESASSESPDFDFLDGTVEKNTIPRKSWKPHEFKLVTDPLFAYTNNQEDERVKSILRSKTNKNFEDERASVLFHTPDHSAHTIEPWERVLDSKMVSSCRKRKINSYYSSIRGQEVEATSQRQRRASL